MNILQTGFSIGYNDINFVEFHIEKFYITNKENHWLQVSGTKLVGD